MCHDLVRFSCSESESHPISIDYTFNMGQYKVTPVVYKQLFLRTKRYGTGPVFIGPTMIHHKKDVDTYKVPASTCASNCKGLTNAKKIRHRWRGRTGSNLENRAYKATHLRCVRHFEGSCKQKLHEIGIRDAKSQKSFLDLVLLSSRKN